MINQLSSKQANMIVDRLMKDIPYNINIISKDGYIMASGNKDRIGDFHKSGKLAADTKQTVLVYKDDEGERKGANEPVLMDNQIIAVVGISGDPEEVADFSKILSSMVILLLKQTEETKRQHAVTQQKDRFLQLLLDHEEEPYSDELIEVSMSRFNLDLSNRIVVAFYPPSDQLEQLYKNGKNPVFKYQYGYLRFFYQNTFNDRQLLDVQTQRVLIDDRDSLSESIHNVWNTSLFLKMFQIETEKVVPVQDYPQFLIDYTAIKMNRKTIRKVRELDADLKETLVSFVKYNMKTKATSDALHIHRNTLTYRLSRIEALTNLNPTHVMELYILIYTLMYLYKNEQGKME